MTDPRLRTIRFWLLSVAVCGACLVTPCWAVYFLATYAMAPLGLFMPVFASSNCTVCVADAHSTIQIDVIDIAAGTCGACTGYNRSTIVTRDMGGVLYTCEWSASVAGGSISPADGCAGLGGQEGLVVRFGYSAAGNKTRYTGSLLGSNQWSMNGSGATQNCDNPDTSSSVEFSTGACDFSPSSVTATPL